MVVIVITRKAYFTCHVPGLWTGVGGREGGREEGEESRSGFMPTP